MDPAISVVVTTQNMATYLDLTLAALENQVLPVEIWEVVIWDDRSNDATAAILDRYEARARLNLVRRRSEERIGSIAARNAALEIARGRIVVFLADNHLVPENFLVNHLKHHRDVCRVVVGNIRLRIHTHLYAPSEPEIAGCSPIPAISAEELYKDMDWKWLAAEMGSNYQPIFEYFHRCNQFPVFPWVYFHSANSSVPRAQMLELNGFDAQYNGFGLEEYDLARRLHRAGLQFRYEPLAYSFHQLHPKAAVDRRLLHSDIARFMQQHPDLNILERQLISRGNYPLT